MKTKQKLVIVVAAVLLTFFGFSLLAAPAVDLIKTGKDAGNLPLAEFVAQADVTVHAHLKG